MDNFYYVLLTNIVIIVSFATFILLLSVHIAKKKKPNFFAYFIALLCCVGMYLFVPARYLCLGYAFKSPELLEKSIKFSIIPYEKALAYSYLSDIYNYDISNDGVKDGNKAIEYMEKALNGEYSKYSFETAKLATLYSIKGDYSKTLELNNVMNKKQSLSLLNMYIMNNNYEKALETFPQNDKSRAAFLKADLYKKLGKISDAERTKKIANQIYATQLNNCKDSSSRSKYIEDTKKYHSVEAYKNWLRKQAKEYKFAY